MPAAKAQCESMGMRLAVFHTQADWEAAKSFLNAYNSLYGYVKHNISFITINLRNCLYSMYLQFNYYFLYAHIKSLASQGIQSEKNYPIFKNIVCQLKPRVKLQTDKNPYFNHTLKFLHAEG